MTEVGLDEETTASAELDLEEDMLQSPAAAGDATLDAMRLSPVDLVHRPCTGAVLLDIWTGAAPRAGDLTLSLTGCGPLDRARDEASMPCSDCDREMLPTPPATRTPAGFRANFSTITGDLSAELSTIPLRWRPNGRCAGSWITSETVPGHFPNPPKSRTTP
jgi:hypothetical protein